MLIQHQATMPSAGQAAQAPCHGQGVPSAARWSAGRTGPRLSILRSFLVPAMWVVCGSHCWDQKTTQDREAQSCAACRPAWHCAHPGTAQSFSLPPPAPSGSPEPLLPGSSLVAAPPAAARHLDLLTQRQAHSACVPSVRVHYQRCSLVAGCKHEHSGTQLNSGLNFAPKAGL